MSIDKDDVLTHSLIVPVFGAIIFKWNGTLDYSWRWIALFCVAYPVLFFAGIYFWSFISSFGLIKGVQLALGMEARR